MAKGLIDRATSNAASQRLLGAAGQYVQARAKRWMEDLAEKAGGAPGGIADKVSEVVSGDGKSQGKQPSKATVIIEDIDVGVPVSTAFNRWTQYQEFASFMKGVETVDPRDEVSQNWRVKIGPSRRSFEGRIMEQVPDRRIKWISKGAKGTSNGVITFHPLADDLTKILVVIEYYPSGPIEHIGNAFRVIGRRTRLDLKNFRRYVTLKGEAKEGFRQEIRNGKVQGREQDQEEPAGRGNGRQRQGNGRR
jgi:uncharacterized membrane protein